MIFNLVWLPARQTGSSIRTKVLLRIMLRDTTVCEDDLARIMHARSFCATGTPRYQGVSHQVKVPIRTLLIYICRSMSYPADWKLYFEADNVLIGHGFLP